MKQDRLKDWHNSATGLVFFTAVEAAITYGFISLSIDRGNFLWYLLALVFLIGTIRNFISLIGKIIHGNNSARRT